MITIWGRNITYEIYFSLRAFYVTNIFTVPITIFAGYIIWTKTPPEMKSYKLILMNIWVGCELGSDLLFARMVD